MQLTDYITLGASGLRVSPMGLGTMTFGKDWGWGADEAEARRIFDIYTERGGNFIDTANVYTNGSSETLIGQFAGGRRDRLVIATKYTLNAFFPGDPNAGGNHRKSMVRSVEASLKRLNSDYIDLLYLHAWDGTTPVDEIMRGFDDLVRAGKVLYAGMSDTPAWQVARMQTLATLRGWSPLVALQIQWNLTERTGERDLVPMANELGLGVTAWSPLAMGVLAGKYSLRDLERLQSEAPVDTPASGARVDVAHSHSVLTERALAIGESVAQIAKKLGHSPSQVALAWLLARGANPIVGARTAAQLEDNLGALELQLDEDTQRELNEISTIPLGFPHDFLKLATPRGLIFGGTQVQVRRAVL